jgi:hypothetical protein
MDDEELSARLEKIIATLAEMQAVNLANHYLLAEIMRDLADTARNRHDYLAGMFERISARADPLPIDGRAQELNASFRETLSKFFAEIARSPNAPPNRAKRQG